MIIKLFINTNEFNDESNFFVEVINNESYSISLVHPSFTEILSVDDITPTGIYYFELNLDLGNYYITVKHNTLSKTGTLHFLVKEDKYELLENSIIDMPINEDNSISFA